MRPLEEARAWVGGTPGQAHVGHGPDHSAVGKLEVARTVWFWEAPVHLRPRGRPSRASIAAAAVVLLVAACSGNNATDSQANPSPSTSSPVPAHGPTAPYTAHPDSIAVLSHSGATGEGTEPYEGIDTTTNSWVTGTNPKVNSLYQRILAENPSIQGHAQNLGQPSANIAAIYRQASTLVDEGAPDLVIIQTIDQDIVCPDPDFDTFGDGLATVLDTLHDGSPHTRVFITTQLGSPETYAKSLRPDQRKAMGGTGPCAFIDPQGKIVPKELNRLESIIQGYEEQVFEVCERYETCAHDGGAFSRVVERPGDFGEDLNHFSIQGHARAATVAWKAMQDAGLLPAD